VRTDTKKLLLAADVIPGYANKELTTVEIVEPGAHSHRPPNRPSSTYTPICARRGATRWSGT
jgi:hypothetical protein